MPAVVSVSFRRVELDDVPSVEFIQQNYSRYAAQSIQRTITRSARRHLPRVTGRLINGFKVRSLGPTRAQLEQDTPYFQHVPRARQWQFGEKRGRRVRKGKSEMRKAIIRGARAGLRRVVSDALGMKAQIGAGG